MRRTDREITDFHEMMEILKSCDCCRIGLLDGQEAYIVPMNFGYEECGEHLTLYFHYGSLFRANGMDISGRNGEEGCCI